jgi:hypothetical protein
VGQEVWTNNAGENLYDPYPHREPIHGATDRLKINPTMLILDGREVLVQRVLERWGIFEKPDHISTGLQLEMADGRQVVVVHFKHERWLLAS